MLRLRLSGDSLMQYVRLFLRSMTVAQTAPPLVAATVTLTWVDSDQFTASGDIAPYIRDGLGAELGSVWNHQLTGAGSTSYEVVRGIDLVLVRVVGLFGGSEMIAQQILLAICVATAAFGAAFFARTFLRRPAAVAAAGLLAVFNPFLLVLLPNPLFPLAIGLCGILAGILLRANSRSRVSPVALGLATIPVAYLAVNPPLLVVVAGWTIVVAITANLAVGPGSTARALQMLARAAPIAIVLSLWWTVPFAFTLLRGGSGVTVAAQTNIDAWAWSHADNSIANIVTLEAHWGWAYADVFPFRSYLDSGVWPALRWILPLGAVAGVFLARTAGRGRHPRWVRRGRSGHRQGTTRPAPGVQPVVLGERPRVLAVPRTDEQGRRRACSCVRGALRHGTRAWYHRTSRPPRFNRSRGNYWARLRGRRSGTGSLTPLER